MSSGPTAESLDLARESSNSSVVKYVRPGDGTLSGGGGSVRGKEVIFCIRHRYNNRKFLGIGYPKEGEGYSANESSKGCLGAPNLLYAYKL